VNGTTNRVSQRTPLDWKALPPIGQCRISTALVACASTCYQLPTTFYKLPYLLHRLQPNIYGDKPHAVIALALDGRLLPLHPVVILGATLTQSWLFDSIRLKRLIDRERETILVHVLRPYKFSHLVTLNIDSASSTVVAGRLACHMVSEKMGTY